MFSKSPVRRPPALVLMLTLFFAGDAYGSRLAAHGSRLAGFTKKQLINRVRVEKYEGPERLRRRGIPRDAVVGRTFLITGGTSGIGMAVGVMALELGAKKVYFAGRKEDHEETGEGRLSEFIKEWSGQAEFIQMDVTNEDSVKAAIDRVGPELDFLVLAAGIAHGANKIGEGEPSAQREVVATNYTGARETMHYAMPWLRANKGSIVAIGSAAKSGDAYDGGDAYAATKAALFATVRGARREQSNPSANRVWAPLIMRGINRVAGVEAAPTRGSTVPGFVNVGEPASRGPVARWLLESVHKLAVSLLKPFDEFAVKVGYVEPGITATSFQLRRFDGDRKRVGDIERDVEPLKPADVAHAVFRAGSRISPVHEVYVRHGGRSLESALSK